MQGAHYEKYDNAELCVFCSHGRGACSLLLWLVTPTEGFSLILYKRCMQADLISGLTVGVMAVPQSVSFAAMAGVPAAFGLYTAFVPVLAYCLMGSSRHLVSITVLLPLT